MAVIFKMTPTSKCSSYNFTTIFFTLFFNATGILMEFQPDSLYSKFVNILKYYLAYAFIFLTSGQIFMLVRSRITALTTLNLVFFLNGVFLNMLTFFVHVKKANFFIIYNLVVSGFNLYTRRDSVSTNERFKNFFLSYGAGYIIASLLTMTMPILGFPFSNKKLGDLDTLFIACKYPWNIDTYFKYTLTVLMQFSWLGPLLLPTLFNIIFLCYFIIETRVQFKILVKSIKNVDRYRSERSIKNHLRDCVTHHHKILKFVQNFKACYNQVFTANLVYSVTTLGLLLLVLIQGDKSFLAMTRTFFNLVISLWHLFLFCYIGQLLKDKNDELLFSLYSTKWYKKSLKIRKIICIMMSNMQTIANLRAGHSYLASFQLFYNVVQRAYNFYNVLLQTFPTTIKDGPVVNI